MIFPQLYSIVALGFFGVGQLDFGNLTCCLPVFKVVASTNVANHSMHHTPQDINSFRMRLHTDQGQYSPEFDSKWMIMYLEFGEHTRNSIVYLFIEFPLHIFVIIMNWAMFQHNWFPFFSFAIGAVTHAQTLLGLWHNSLISHIGKRLVAVVFLALVLTNFIAHFEIHNVKAHVPLHIYNLRREIVFDIFETKKNVFNHSNLSDMIGIHQHFTFCIYVLQIPIIMFAFQIFLQPKSTT